MSKNQYDCHGRDVANDYARRLQPDVRFQSMSESLAIERQSSNRSLAKACITSVSARASHAMVGRLKQDVLNTRPLAEVEAFLKTPKSKR
jgi:hypothetical protein